MDRVSIQKSSCANLPTSHHRLAKSAGQLVRNLDVSLHHPDSICSGISRIFQEKRIDGGFLIKQLESPYELTFPSLHDHEALNIVLVQACRGTGRAAG
ncbi:hypothetical protein NC651_028062 [Populus alba x Populus x berolinensis]|nr:hypothetical protein NC651_028062 [Populus alba x Populus x berolinensis]